MSHRDLPDVSETFNGTVHLDDILDRAMTITRAVEADSTRNLPFSRSHILQVWGLLTRGGCQEPYSAMSLNVELARYGISYELGLRSAMVRALMHWEKNYKVN